jgi:cytochrome c553
MLKTILIATALAASATAWADGATIPPAARLAATCAACHGTNGATVGANTGANSGNNTGSNTGSNSGSNSGTTLPPLAGQPRQALAAALHDFKTGKRQATIMTQIAKGYTDEQLEQLATWFAAQKP